MSLEQLSKPFDRAAMVEELNIENPLVADCVQVWISIRQQRMAFELDAMEKLGLVNAELAKFH